LEKYESPGNDEIPVELIQAGYVTLPSEIHNLINSSWSKEELPDQWNGSIIVPVYKKGDRTDCIHYSAISLLSVSYKIISNILSKLSPCTDEIIGIISIGFNVRDRLLIRFFKIH
jgi:hypothetical protein